MRERRGRIVSILLIFTLIVGILQPIGGIKVTAEETETDASMFLWSSNINTLQATIDGLTLSGSYMENFVIPTTYVKNSNIYSVVKIGRNAFKDNTKLKSIVIPNGIQEIDEGAFSGCTKLETIIIPSSVKKIGNGVFKGCTNLKNIELSNGIEQIEGNAFYDCTSLQSIVIPDSVTLLGGQAFFNCNNLKTVELSKNLETLGTAGLFQNCYNLTKVTNFPQNVTIIGNGAFRNCSKLETVDINFNNIKQIGEYAFWNCGKCESIQEIVLENEMIFGAFAFAASSLKSIIVKENVAVIPKYMFQRCESLETAIFSNIGYIDENAFEGTLSLKNFNLSNVTDIRGKAFNGSAIENIDLSSITTIYDGAFSNCNNLKAVTFSSDLQSIRSEAFKNCDKLTDICIPNKVTSIGINAFKTSGITIMTNLYTDNVQALNYNWTGSNRNITQHSASDYDKQPNAIQVSKTYYKANPTNISFSVNLGRGSKAATNVSSVMIDYKELEESNYELIGNIITIKKEALNSLNKGAYDVGITFNDVDQTSITGTLTLLVIESSSSNSGTNDKHPVALETLSYQFYKDYQRDIVVPIQMNSANTLEELYLGTEPIEKENYSFKNNTIIIDKMYLNTITSGVYRLIPVFDGEQKINNLLLEVYEKYDDRLLPYLLPSHISFENQDLRLRVELGEGKTKAKDIKLLVIDDMYITPNGETYPKNPFTYQLSVSGSAIKKNKMSLSLGRTMVSKEQEKFNPVYYLDGDELVLTAKLIKKLGFYPDTIHTVGCIFDNSEETASLNRVTLVIPNQNQNNNENNGNENNNGNNSNEDSNNSGNENNGNNNNQGNNSNGDSSNSGNENNGNGSNSGNQNSGNSSQGSNSNQNNNISGLDSNSNQQQENNIGKPIEENVLTTETITLKDIIYTGKRDVVITLMTTKEKTKHVKLNGKELKEKEYKINGNQLVILRSTLNKLKDGTNGLTIQTKSDILRTYIAFIEFDFSKEESKIPFMTTYKLLLKGSKFPIYLSNQKDAKKITWKTTNPKIVSVSKKGILTAKKKGKATVTCVITNKKGDLYKFQIKVTVKDGKKKSFYTKIKDKSYNSKFPVFIMDKLVYKGKTVHIKVSNLAKDSKISFKSSNPSVATVDKKGNIKGIKKGKATITVTLKQNKETYIYQLLCQCK